ncbi:hypothetical protein Tco_1010340 [Tanacetum coccineum]
MSWFSRCSWCGGPFNSVNCRHCTNVSFGDELVYDSNPNSYNQTPNFSNPLPHHNYETDSRSDTGATFQGEFAKLQQNFERFMAQLSCSYCGGPFNGGNCPSCSIVGAGNEFVHDPNPFPYDNTPDFYDQPPQHHVETYSCQLCGILTMVMIVHHGSRLSMSRNQATVKTLVIIIIHRIHRFDPNYSGFNRPSQYPIDQSPPQEMSLQDMELQKQQYLEEMQSISNHIQIKDYRNERIDIHYRRACEIQIDELKANFNKMSIEINKKKELRQREQRTIPLNEIISQIPASFAITPVLPTMEPEDSHTMGDENLSTIPEKKSDEFIKFSVEEIIPIRSESEDTFDDDSECDLPSCDDFSSIDVPRDNSVTFSNPLFDSNDDFTSSDDESLSDEDVLEDIENKDSYVSNHDEPASLVTPLSYANEDEYFDPRSLKDEPDNDDLNIMVPDIDKRTKTRPKWTKPSTGMERAQKTKAERIFMFNEPTRHVGNPKAFYWLFKHGENPRAKKTD